MSFDPAVRVTLFFLSDDEILGVPLVPLDDFEVLGLELLELELLELSGFLFEGFADELPFVGETVASDSKADSSLDLTLSNSIPGLHNEKEKEVE